MRSLRLLLAVTVLLGALGACAQSPTTAEIAPTAARPDLLEAGGGYGSGNRDGGGYGSGNASTVSTAVAGGDSISTDLGRGGGYGSGN